MLQVREQKQAADAKTSAEQATEKADKELPDKAKSVAKVKDLVCLLPNSMAGEFGQCLALLESLLQQANTAAAEARVQEVPDSDSDMATEGAASPHNTFMNIPLFPGCTERLHSEAACRMATDPYMGSDGGCKTPPRGRTRSEDPGRSPLTRSRTHSPNSKQQTEDSQSRERDAANSLRRRMWLHLFRDKA